MNKKIILVSFLTLFLSGVFLFIDIARGEETAKSPAENSLCWTKKDCEDLRTEKGWPEAGFIDDDPDCPGYAGNLTKPENKWGRCLAGVQTTAQVSFGGEEYKTFNNVGDYIRAVYNYALIILSILASIMIIVAGIQYVGSAGSQEMIGSAKKKISGAIIGLALAYMSYTILNMINPATVNLRLPQVYMIREINLTTWCSAVEIPDANTQYSSNNYDPVLAEAESQSGGSVKEKVKFEQTPASLTVFKDAKAHITYDQYKTKCGREYEVSLQGEKCTGVGCVGERIDGEEGICGDGVNGPRCVCVSKSSKPEDYICKKGFFGGSLKVAGNSSSYFENLHLYIVCKIAANNAYFAHIQPQASVAANRSSQNYVLNIEKQQIENYCKGANRGGTAIPELAGMLMVAEINDKNSVDDEWLITRKMCNSNVEQFVGSNDLGKYISNTSQIMGSTRCLVGDIFKSKEDCDKLYSIISDPNNLIQFNTQGVNCDLSVGQQFKSLGDDLFINN